MVYFECSPGLLVDSMAGVSILVLMDGVLREAGKPQKSLRL